jgi:6,7-dimethyl-8-ribityllumazine synthase
MADRDAWEKAESVSKIFAAVLIPVVLGVAGLFANQALERSKTELSLNLGDDRGQAAVA